MRGMGNMQGMMKKMQKMQKEMMEAQVAIYIIFRRRLKKVAYL